MLFNALARFCVFLTALRKPVNRSLSFGKLYGHFLCLVEVYVSLVKVEGLVEFKPKYGISLLLLSDIFGIHTYYAAKIKGKARYQTGYGSLEKSPANAKRNIGKVQGRISLVVYRVYICSLLPLLRL